MMMQEEDAFTGKAVRLYGGAGNVQAYLVI